MGAPLVGVAPIFAMSFLGFGIGKKLQQKDPNEKLTELQLFYAGAFSGIFTTVIMAPGERIKCLLQIQQGDVKPKYRGPVDCIKQLYAEGGLRSIFKGSCATLLRGKNLGFNIYSIQICNWELFCIFNRLMYLKIFYFLFLKNFL